MQRRVASGLFTLAIGVGLIWVGRRDGGPARSIDPTLVVDVNTAPAGVLMALPGLGPTIVGRIVEERERRPFASMDELDRRVPRFGPALAAMLRPHLRFGPAADASEDTTQAP